MAHQITPIELAKAGTEHAEQRAFFCWLLINNRQVWEHTFAIPNGGYRGEVQGGRLKAEGVKPGVPDIMLAYPHSGSPYEYAPGQWTKQQYGYAGLFIEMKRSTRKKATAGKLGEGQEPWHDRLRSAGYRVDVAWTWQEAGAAVLRYLGIPETAPVWATLAGMIEG
jgi:hypothetical protein